MLSYSYESKKHKDEEEESLELWFSEAAIFVFQGDFLLAPEPTFPLRACSSFGEVAIVSIMGWGESSPLPTLHSSRAVQGSHQILFSSTEMSTLCHVWFGS